MGYGHLNNVIKVFYLKKIIMPYQNFFNLNNFLLDSPIFEIIFIRRGNLWNFLKNGLLGLFQLNILDTLSFIHVPFFLNNPALFFYLVRELNFWLCIFLITFNLNDLLKNLYPLSILYFIIYFDGIFKKKKRILGY